MDQFKSALPLRGTPTTSKPPPPPKKEKNLSTQVLLFYVVGLILGWDTIVKYICSTLNFSVALQPPTNEKSLPEVFEAMDSLS
jgi:hypothetical protein